MSHSGRPSRAAAGRQQIEQALPVPWHEGVEIDELPDALGRAVGNAGRHHAPVAVPDEGDVLERLELDHGQGVGDVRLEVDRGARMVRPLTEARVGRREHLVARGPEQRTHLLPRPSRRPRPMTDQKRRHP
jgi:hypothetical protein